MSERQRVADWWRTSIIDMHPGVIRLRGYAIEELIGRTSFADMVWLMLKGELPSPAAAALLEAALVASVDHGPQSPAIAIARMAVTSGNALNNAMGSAVNVLGDVHGGAGEQCMELFYYAAQRIDAGLGQDAALELALQNYRRERGGYIAGFGHRFHPVDPRAAPLLQLVAEAAARGHISGRYAAIARAVEAQLQQAKGQPIPLNIDGATAVIFCELGLEPALGRGVFILSRAVGILSHAWEQRQRNERIKGPTPPEFLYTYDGPAPRAVPERDRQQRSAA